MMADTGDDQARWDQVFRDQVAKDPMVEAVERDIARARPWFGDFFALLPFKKEFPIQCRDGSILYVRIFLGLHGMWMPFLEELGSDSSTWVRFPLGPVLFALGVF